MLVICFFVFFVLFLSLFCVLLVVYCYLIFFFNKTGWKNREDKLYQCAHCNCVVVVVLSLVLFVPSLINLYKYCTWVSLSSLGIGLLLNIYFSHVLLLSTFLLNSFNVFNWIKFDIRYSILIHLNCEQVCKHKYFF